MSSLERFLGGSVPGVLLRLVVVSIAVGAVLAWLNISPWDLVASIRRFFERLLSHGFEAVRDLFAYFLLGAMIVVPVWLVIRLMKSTPAGRR